MKDLLSSGQFDEREVDLKLSKDYETFLIVFSDPQDHGLDLLLEDKSSFVLQAEVLLF